MFLSRLLHNVMKPPVLHVRTCSILKLLSHAHAHGVGDNSHPYLMLTRSQNSCLVSMYPLPQSVEGPAMLKQLPQCWCRLAVHCWPVSLDLILTSFCWLYPCPSRLIFFLILLIVSFWLLHVLSCHAVNDMCFSVSSNMFWILFLWFWKKQMFPSYRVSLAVIIQVFYHFHKACYLWSMV